MTKKNHINSSRKELEVPSCSRDFAEALEHPCCWSKSLSPCASVSLLQQGAPRTCFSDVWLLQDLSPGKPQRTGQESCVEMVTLIPNLRCCVGVGAPTLPGVLPCWEPRKESLRLDPTPYQYLLARRRWEEKFHFDLSSNPFAHFKACLVPI